MSLKNHGGDWKSHHGTASDGTRVKSLSSRIVGDRMSLRNMSGKTIDGTPQEFEIFSVDILRGLGYAVTAPSSAANRNSSSNDGDTTI